MVNQKLRNKKSIKDVMNKMKAKAKQIRAEKKELVALREVLEFYAQGQVDNGVRAKKVLAELS